MPIFFAKVMGSNGNANLGPFPHLVDNGKEYRIFAIGMLENLQVNLVGVKAIVDFKLIEILDENISCFFGNRMGI